jgi:hypothetical protein
MRALGEPEAAQVPTLPLGVYQTPLGGLRIPGLATALAAMLRSSSADLECQEARSSDD